MIGWLIDSIDCKQWFSDFLELAYDIGIVPYSLEQLHERLSTPEQSSILMTLQRPSTIAASQALRHYTAMLALYHYGGTFVSFNVGALLKPVSSLSRATVAVHKCTTSASVAMKNCIPLGGSHYKVLASLDLVVAPSAEATWVATAIKVLTTMTH